MGRIILGVEKFLSRPPAWAARARVGLLTHPAAVDGALRSSVERLAYFFGPRLEALFGPQHGFWGEKQDNMVASTHGRHPELGVKIFSLYGPQRKPEPDMLFGLDALIVDLQDVGCRVYTYIQTLRLVMEACAEQGVKVVVLDRPNPLGRAAEGNLLADDCRSFVGLFELPMRHGLTMAELALMIRAELNHGQLEVVPMDGYDPEAPLEETGFNWVMPSPNMPSLKTALVYPGQVLFEGTNISEGRGTTRPFETWGAPFIDPYALRDRLQDYGLEGVVLRPIYFEPTFHKFAHQVCGGLFIHVVDRSLFKPYRTSLSLLQAAAQLWPEEVAFKEPPYEYEYQRRPIDLILGRKGLADEIVAPRPLKEIEAGWAGDLERFIASRQEYFLY